MHELGEDHEEEEEEEVENTGKFSEHWASDNTTHTRMHALHKNSGSTTKMVMKCINAMVKCQCDTPSQNQIRSRLTLHGQQVTSEHNNDNNNNNNNYNNIQYCNNNNGDKNQKTRQHGR